ncbi:uracil phosphoribosyltransferase [Ligilactobacillus acidipiscis DSM 15836]|uniref:Uracil phosphoribosyltransferase n=1 Tax=Ligilactobacillus acidipiscis DSM 15836 TaxID=1423716 RepID=A0ABR5PMD1_9LACO|nr:uracil phosphoribosyltransferase [Ligilactobacillus acidipiscis]KRM28218.1 uracil phosphoribosyltransferase [Ligilactobacillus acidipiscis DSM 15836]GAW64113.1 uracil phosphoribosyltransferase [Ligilactobacillus acidipiscis]GEN21172.1 uracil phosphoribosyltransferase [Ligilactobacillus acidipiscis]
MGKFEILDHPLIQHKLTIIRNEKCGTREFRQVVNEIAELMAYEVSRDMLLEDVQVKTPVEVATEKQLAGKKVVIVPILRAGLGMVDGILELIPAAKVGHIGMYRDEETLQPHEYFVKMPDDIANREMIIVDPMLATGGSAIMAVDALKKRGAKTIKFVCLVAAPEGVKALREKHPDIDVYAAALDDHLNEDGYIVPGLGDAGDRLFGTK